MHYGKLNLMLPSALKVAENYIYSYEMHKNCCHQSCSFWSRYAPNRVSAGALPQTPLGELIALPRPPSWFRGWDPQGRGGEGKGGKGVGGIATPPPGTGKEEKGMEGRMGGEGREGEGKEGEGRERK